MSELMSRIAGYIGLLLGFFVGLLTETLARLVLWLSQGELSVNFDYLRGPDPKFRFDIIADQTTKACCEMIREMTPKLDDDEDLFDDWDVGYTSGRSSAYRDIIEAIENGAWKVHVKDITNERD